MRVFPNTKLSAVLSQQTALRSVWRGAALYAALVFLLFSPGYSSHLFGAPVKTVKKVGTVVSDESRKTDGGSDEDEPTYPEPPDPTANWDRHSPAVGLIGQLNATGVGFQYWNNYMMMNNIWSHLRNVQLVTYTGDTAGSGTVPAADSGIYNSSVSADQVGQYQYSTGGYQTAPYGTGYAPAYESGDPRFSSGYPVYQDGIMMPQTNANTNAVYRGQTQYGDPGTLIYSLWGGVTGGTGTYKEHAGTFGYKTENGAGFIGLDLFGSCDCRSGLFYSYQTAKIKDVNLSYAYEDNPAGTLYDPSTLIGEGAELQYATSYDYPSNITGLYQGNLKTNNHLIGIYHQFGSEFVYNIATLRFGYDKVKTEQNFSENGKTTAEVTKSLATYMDGEKVNEETLPTETTEYTVSSVGMLNGSYNEFLGGLSFERGANLKFFNTLTFVPRGSLDYNYLYREKFSEKNNGIAYLNYDKKSYHSLRSQLGADLALDLYPGDGRLRFLVNGGWIHEFLNYHYGKTTYTDSLGKYYEVQGNSTGRDWGVFGAGGEWAIVPAFMVFINYNYYNNSYVSTSYGDVGLKLMW